MYSNYTMFGQYREEFVNNISIIPDGTYRATMNNSILTFIIVGTKFTFSISDNKNMNNNGTIDYTNNTFLFSFGTNTKFKYDATNKTITLDDQGKLFIFSKVENTISEKVCQTCPPVKPEKVCPIQETCPPVKPEKVCPIQETCPPIKPEKVCPIQETCPPIKPEKVCQTCPPIKPETVRPPVIVQKERSKSIQEEKSKSSKIITYIIIGIVVLLALLLLYFMLKSDPENNSDLSKVKKSIENLSLPSETSTTDTLVPKVVPL
jgi:hypothetical protein